MKKSKIIIIVLILFFFEFLISGCFSSAPIGIRHFVNSMISPNDLYKPIVLDRFLFSEKNFSKTYPLNPTHLDIYEIGFVIDHGGIESTYKFRGKLKIEFFWKDKFLFDNIVTSWDSAGYVQGDMTHYKQISLCKFNIPLQEKYTKDISVKLTVLEPDEELKRFYNLITLYIAVSTSP
jgi:hypothetical protein